MYAIEALQSAGAWQASIKGYLPVDLSSLGGAATSIPATIGSSLAKATNALQVFESLVAGDATSIVGIVVTAIKGVVNSITQAADQREKNWAEARLWYLANVRWIRQASKLKNFWGSGGDKYNGYWRFPRASVAEDRPVPYWDPLGTSGNMPGWLIPDPWSPSNPSRWPDKNWPPWPAVGNWLPESCENWSQISLGASCSGAYNRDAEGVKYAVKHPTIMAWPWAWPLSSPARLAGKWSKLSKGPEDVVAGLYMLPSPQHILTPAQAVADSKKILLLAMKRWFPLAYEAAPGDWRNTGRERPIGPWVIGVDCKPEDKCGGILDPNGDYNVPGVNFTELASALARIAGFERCRAAILERPDLMPQELRAMLKENPDFKGANTKPKPKPKGPGVGAVGGISGKPKPSGGGGAAVALGGLGLAWWVLRR